MLEDALLALAVRDDGRAGRDDDYDPDKDKSVLNEHIADACSAVGVDDDETTYAVLLDAESLGTSTILTNLNIFDPSKIIVTNPVGVRIARAAREEGMEELKVVPQFIGRFLDAPQLAEHTAWVGLVYLDYMCTWEGNESCRPQDDLKRLFETDWMHHGSVLALTLCYRDSHATSDVIEKVRRLASDNEYRVHVHSVVHYSSSSNNEKRGAAMRLYVFTVWYEEKEAEAPERWQRWRAHSLMPSILKPGYEEIRPFFGSGEHASCHSCHRSRPILANQACICTEPNPFAKFTIPHFDGDDDDEDEEEFGEVEDEADEDEEEELDEFEEEELDEFEEEELDEFEDEEDGENERELADVPVDDVNNLREIMKFNCQHCGHKRLRRMRLNAHLSCPGCGRDPFP